MWGCMVKIKQYLISVFFYLLLKIHSIFALENIQKLVKDFIVFSQYE